MLTLEAASRSYGRTVALAPLTLRLHAGTVCLVSGPNGSGKTTLLRLAAGIATPSTGTRHMTGSGLYLRSGDGMRQAQTVGQAVAFAAALSRQTRRCDLLLDLVGMGAWSTTPVRSLSAGQRARASLAVALAAAPTLVCLDEPTAHLDAEGVRVAADVVHRLTGQGSAVLVATHDLQWLAADGRIALDGGRVEESA